MNTLPAPFIERMKKQLEDEAEAFFQALQTDPPVSIRLNPGKTISLRDTLPILSQAQPVEWCEDAYYLPERPVFTLDPHFHAGAYYVQEASSMFLQYILRQLNLTAPLRVLDLCAAPGGKSTLIASQLSTDSLLVSNEVVRSRATILKENIIKWGQANIVVTNNDPGDFHSLKDAFDIIVVDAPCSGEGMFRKDPGSITEWSEANLRLCSERQQKILTDIWDSLKPDGYLIYSTCTYNPGENERILEWMISEFNAQSLEINHTFQDITPGKSTAHCYHFYPHKTKGEGFFIGVVQKTERKEYYPKKNKKHPSATVPALPDSIRQMIRQPELYTPYRQENSIGIIPTGHADFIRRLEEPLRILYKGCEVVEVLNRKIKLLPPFALWQGINTAACPVYDTDRNTALTFLKKEDIPVPAISGDWLLVSYKGAALGWCKNLGNRLNNYYPKEWRIRMQLEADPEAANEK